MLLEKYDCRMLAIPRQDEPNEIIRKQYKSNVFLNGKSEDTKLNDIIIVMLKKSVEL